MGKLYVLGGSGFVGGAIMRRLAPRWDAVSVSSRDVDLCDPSAVREFMDTLSSDDMLVFTAAVVRAKQDTYDSFLANVRMVVNVACVLEHKRLAHVIFLSSIDVYRMVPGVTITESSPLGPSTLYGSYKVAAEFVLSHACALSVTPFAVLRCGGLYGPGVAPSLVHDFIHRAIEGMPVRMIGEGKALRDYVFVDDIGLIVEEFLRRNVVGTFNVGTGNSISIREIAQIVGECVGRKLVIEDVPAHSPMYDISLDAGALRRVLGGAELTNMCSGIRRTVEYMRSREV